MNKKETVNNNLIQTWIDTLYATALINCGMVFGMVLLSKLYKIELRKIMRDLENGQSI